MTIATLENVARLYVATFNRAPVKAGLEYWVNSSSLALEEIAQSFFDQPETQGLYPEGTSDSAFVTSIYQNLFNRAPLQAGIDYWTGPNALGGYMTRGQMILAMVNGAKGGDAELVANKAEVGMYYAQSVLTAQDHRLSSVTADDATVTTAMGEIDLLTASTLLEAAQSQSVINNGIDQDTLLPWDSSIVSALNQGVNWLTEQSVSDSITYSFNETMPSEYSSNDTHDWTVVPASVGDVVDEIMLRCDGVILPEIEKSFDGDGLIRLNMVTPPENWAGYAYYPGSDDINGDIFLGHDIGSDEWSGSLAPYGGGRATIIHELGHALGLKHPFEGLSVLDPEDDHGANTVMSYTAYRFVSPQFTLSPQLSASVEYVLKEPGHFMSYDISALQAIYGPDTNCHASDDIYDFDTQPFYTTIWDAGGYDTLDFTATTHENLIDLTPGSQSNINYRDLNTQITEQQAIYDEQINNNSCDDWVSEVLNGVDTNLYTGEKALSIAYGVIIEKIIGGPAGNCVIDNSVDNFLVGGVGNDFFHLGAGGFDRVDGSGGYDLVVLDGYTKKQVGLSACDDNTILLAGDGFAVQMVGIDGVQFADELYLIG